MLSDSQSVMDSSAVSTGDWALLVVVAVHSHRPPSQCTAVPCLQSSACRDRQLRRRLELCKLS